MPERVADQCREFGARVIAALLEDEAAAQRRKPAQGHLAGLVEDAFLEPGEPSLDQPGRALPEGRDAYQRAAGRSGLDAALDRLGRRRERDDLDRGDHLPRLDDRKRREGAEGDRLIDE